MALQLQLMTPSLGSLILDPKAKEVAGFSPTIMPPYTLTDEQIVNIIAYIKTLK